MPIPSEWVKLDKLVGSTNHKIFASERPVKYFLKKYSPYKLVSNGLYNNSKKLPPKVLYFQIIGKKIITKYKGINNFAVCINFLNLKFSRIKVPNNNNVLKKNENLIWVERNNKQNRNKIFFISYSENILLSNLFCII